MRSLKGYSYRIKSVSVLRAEWRLFQSRARPAGPPVPPYAKVVQSRHKGREPSLSVLFPACFSAFYASRGLRTNRMFEGGL